ncbi:hypothetical protein [Lysobacter gummosus]|uniref:Uncharacterized protein n=1 Tax=Lysobacter gummosus TaxID=262324 RepID=A0ABY3XDR6_9GAMM|nr:hypothetical protein [Lysobacter gummosus]ALN93823.1 hypothetical protein LG3211_4889 [Lysobacter gummosus]UNP29262.1 hypothetical protein MOV92_22795 [Lysobacter gummosus]
MQDQKEALKDHLRGMNRHNRTALVQLIAVTDWRGIAQRELERRAGLVFQVINDEVMVAIAKGEVDVNQAIAEVLAG